MASLNAMIGSLPSSSIVSNQNTTPEIDPKQSESLEIVSFPLDLPAVSMEVSEALKANGLAEGSKTPSVVPPPRQTTGVLSHPALTASAPTLAGPVSRDDLDPQSQLEDLTARCDGLTITPDLESGAFQFTRKTVDPKVTASPTGFYVIGKILTLLASSPKDVEDSVKAAWKLLSTIKMQVIEENLFLFKFSNKLDRRMVCREGPWRHQERTMVVKAADPGSQLVAGELLEVPFWVQIYGIPPQYRDEEFLQWVGSKFYKFTELDPVTRFNRELS